MIDNLDKLVQLAQISGGINVQCQFQGEWKIAHESRANTAIAHIVIEGEAWLSVGNETKSHRLQAGSIVFLAQSAKHSLSHNQENDSCHIIPSYTLNERLKIKKISNGNGASFKMFCACFHYEPFAELFGNLPHYFHIRLAQNVLQPLLQLLQQELEQGDNASQYIIDNLSNVLLITIIRNYLAQHPQDVSGILRAVQDLRLSRLISQIIATPEEDWKIEKMLQIIPLSRAQLMRIFKQKIGQTPHAFLHSIRLQQAARLLRYSAESVLTTALSCGFQSETHFNKAFKQKYGMTPGEYRKTRLRE